MSKDGYKNILGFNIFNGRREALLAELEQRAAAASGNLCLFYANSNFLQQCHGDVARFSQPDIVIANDGIALDLAARFLTGSPFAANLNGTDFTPYLITAGHTFKRVFLLGGAPGVASRASAALAAHPGVELVGHANGYDDMQDEAALIARINEAKPDVLLVALGNPKQEYWLLQHRANLQVKLLVGVGALLDFLSGNVARAPLWVQRIHCEWLFRLLGEPRRLFRRYTVEMGRFFLLCFRYQRQQTVAGKRV